MIDINVAEAAAISGAVLDGDGSARVAGVAHDTRSMRPGEIFVALRGERDGHEFLEAARDAGAAAAFVRSDAAVPEGLPALRSDDPAAALTRLAGGVRDRLGARVIAITGSAGKTCTKDFTAHLLAARYATAAATGSYNNEIGVPLTILGADERTEMLVVEIGARGAGHIASLMPLVRPDASIVTNVGAAHVGMFGSVEAVAQAKSEIVSLLAGDACAILNADDARVAAMAERTPAEVLWYGTAESATIRATGIRLDDGARAAFTLHTPDGTADVALPVPGEHMVLNALAAAAAAHRFGVAIDDVASHLATVTTSSHRMRVVDAPGGWTVVDDAYNASPASVAAALKALAVMGRGRRTWAVLGQMAELGEHARDEHDRVGRLAVRLGVGRVVTVGDEALPLHEAARLEGMPPDDAVFAPDADAATKIVLDGVRPGDVVLVKGSRVAGLERVVEAIAT